MDSNAGECDGSGRLTVDDNVVEVGRRRIPDIGGREVDDTPMVVKCPLMGGDLRWNESVQDKVQPAIVVPVLARAVGFDVPGRVACYLPKEMSTALLDRITPNQSDVLPNGPESEVAARRSQDGLVSGAMKNLVGGAVTGVCGFALTVIVTRRLGPSESAGVFEAVAIFTILGVLGQAGAGPALVRSVAAALADNRPGDVRRYVVAATGGVGIVSAALGGMLYATSGYVAQMLDPRGTGQLGFSLRAFAVFVPAACLGGVLLAGTRGFGVMTASVVLDSVTKPILRIVAVIVAFAVAPGPVAAVGAWSVPSLVMLIGAVVATTSLLGSLGPEPEGYDAGVKHVRVWPSFWRFSAFQLASDFFQVGVQWLDILILASLATAAETGIYAAVGRLVIAGLLALVAAAQVLAPRIASLLARDQNKQAEAIYQSTTLWLCAVSFPFYLMTATLPKLFVDVFGSGFESGSLALTILSVGMLLDVSVGPVMVILLMGGRSGLGMVDAGLAGIANVVLNFLLIPPYGISGAAVAWTVSIGIINGMALLQVGKLWSISPFGPAYPRVVFTAGILYGGVPLLGRALVGQEYSVAATVCLFCTPAYFASLYHTEIGRGARQLGRTALSRLWSPGGRSTDS